MDQQPQPQQTVPKGRKSWESMTPKEKRLYGGITAGIAALVLACVVWACANGLGALASSGTTQDQQ